MMKSEFIERTGFEPTGAEYEEIEQEYMGCDIDKDQFCKEWVKNGGIQRLSRMRARRIEELEAEVDQRAKEYGELDQIRVESLLKEQEKRKDIENRLNERIRELEEREAKASIDWAKLWADYQELQRQMNTVKEAFSILGGREETPAVCDKKEEEA